MSNERIKQLDVLLKLADNKAKQCLVDYSKANQAVAKAEQDQQQLNLYLSEYFNKMVKELSDSSTMVTLRHYANFLAKLEVAKEANAKRIPQLKSKASDLYKLYLTAKQKREALQKVLDGVVAQQQTQEDKKEQKQNDEYASNQWYINR